MTSTPTPEPERQWVCHKPGWMGACSPQSTHHNGFDWGCGWTYFPAPSTPVPEASGQSRDGQNQRLRALAVEAVIQEWLAEDISPCRYGAVEYDAECPWHMGEVDWPELARNIAAKLDASPAPSSSPVGDRVPSVHLLLLDIWQALGGDSEAFHPWWAADPSFPDRWAQIVAAVAGDISGLAADSNPPAGALLDIAIQFGAADREEPTE